MISVKKVNNKPLNLLERIYLWEIARGLSITTRHFFTNLFAPKNILTVQYPEQRIPLPGNANLRTRHRLKVRADGSPKCVACFMCQTACPAYCIRIEAAEYTENTVEKYPAVFDIDLSRCVVCGMCVEAHTLGQPRLACFTERVRNNDVRRDRGHHFGEGGSLPQTDFWRQVLLICSVPHDQAVFAVEQREATGQGIDGVV